MSYIHCFNDNHYGPSESLRKLFDELVMQPYENHAPTSAWVTEVINREQKYHRETILDRGRTDFDLPFNGLPSEDKVLLYCYYYLRMHLYSSYHIYTKHLHSQINRNVVFIDFGCGPLTSGIAFWACAQTSNITYLGVDISLAMRQKAKEINDFGPSNRSIPFFQNGRLIRECNRLPNLLENYISDNEQTQIIFNFSYVLASRTINVNALFDVLNQIMQRYRTHSMTVVYQNPPPPTDRAPEMSFLHENWLALKRKLSMCRSQVTESNIEDFSYNQIDRSVYYDILTNQFFAMES